MQAEELEEIKQENRGGIKLEELSLLFYLIGIGLYLPYL